MKTKKNNWLSLSIIKYHTSINHTDGIETTWRLYFCTIERGTLSVTVQVYSLA